MHGSRHWKYPDREVSELLKKYTGKVNGRWRKTARSEIAYKWQTTSRTYNSPTCTRIISIPLSRRSVAGWVCWVSVRTATPAHLETFPVRCQCIPCAPAMRFSLNSITLQCIVRLRLFQPLGITIILRQWMNQIFLRLLEHTKRSSRKDSPRMKI